ncbi:calcium-dependent phosphotriesterase [Collybia nuda]|uniref:Calcium-dependent phosphotriesterase n=1 Tax=Collybia nuda TaxID=64659 RepID=A0A9P6CMF6_9AGAR|nr:calcium-dependent phosphotriesterase [Collybia nuda]
MDDLKDTNRPSDAPNPPRDSNLKVMIALSILIGTVAYGATALAGDGGVDNQNQDIPFKLPPQSVYVDPRSFAVLGGVNATFRESSFETSFNPTSTAPPFFQIFDPSFLTILGPNPSIRQVASNSTFAFAHEAPVYVSATDEVFFASNDGGPLGMSDLDHNSVVGKISLKDVDTAIAKNDSTIEVPVTTLDLPETIQMTNGGTGPYRSSLLLITSGRGPRPPSIALVNPKAPHNVTVLLDNFFGRQFNSLNDIKVHPSGKLFFTDVVYGFLNHFRPNPLMPNQVYRFDPDTGAVRVVATDFDKCNGIAFTADGKTAYIYAFDVDARTHAFKNRRVFAYVDAGVPDGLQVDLKGNVYSGCGDGVQVWNDEGTLLGKFFLGTTSANMVFTKDGRLVIMAETKIFVANIAAQGIPPISP